jgi:hypothetical protein
MDCYLKKQNNPKHTHQHQTYLDDQKPPLEVAPCPDHPRSPSWHRGNVISPAASSTIPAPPLQKISGHLRHHHGEEKQSTTASIAALVPQEPPIESSGATSTPSLETRPPGWTRKKTPLYQYTDSGPTAPPSSHAASAPKRNAHQPTLSPAPEAGHH